MAGLVVVVVGLRSAGGADMRRRDGTPVVGKRGRMLLFFGCLDLVIAFSLLAPESATRTSPLYVWITQVLPLWVCAVLWCGAGVVCVVSAFLRRDGWGWAAAIGVKIGWGILSLGSWLLGGVERGYVSAAIWLGLAYAVSVMASWPEPSGGKVPWIGRRR